MEGIHISLLVVGPEGVQPLIRLPCDHETQNPLFRGWRQHPAAEGGHVCERICRLEFNRSINKPSNNTLTIIIQHLVGKGEEENYKRASGFLS